MDPWKSWALVGIVGAGAFYYYNQSGNKTRGRGRVLPPPEQNPRRNLRTDSKDKRKKEKDSGASDQIGSDVTETSAISTKASSNGGVKKRKGGKNEPSKLVLSSAVEVSKERDINPENDDGQGEGMDNAELARQLTSTKIGTSLKKPANASETNKTRRQGMRNEAQPETANANMPKLNGAASKQDLSTASSTTGADADDDMSLTNSPEIGATRATTPSAAYVSDMLEAPAKGPSILRVTEPANPQPIRQPKVQKAAQEPETKKQRQARRKNEERKVLQQEAEKQRRVLLERQLRTAREAEGRPAKNGLGSSKPSTNNAWAKLGNSSELSAAASARTSHQPLLDTFSDSATSSSTNKRNSNTKQNTTNGMSKDTKGWNGSLPSEEEQMRLLNEMDTDKAWSTVEKGGKSKKKASAPDQESASAEKKDTSNVVETTVTGNSVQIQANTTNLNGTASANNKPTVTSSINASNSNSSHEIKGVKATYATIDHTVWNFDNIQGHPDYDPDYPYALTGHPDDDEWAVE